MTAASLSEQATSCFQAGRANDAEELCRRILAGAPDDFTANSILGAIRFGQGRPAEALEFFDRAARTTPGFAIFSNRGAALQMLGRLDEALASYDAALALEPNHAVLLYNRGRTLEDLGRLDEALAAYQKALSLNPNYALALNNLGNTLRALNRPDEALAAYDRALGIEPGQTQALYNRANLKWMVKNDYHGGLADLERLVALNPDYDYARGELLFLRMKGGDWRDFERERRAINAGVKAGRRVIQPFHYQALSDSPADLQHCAEIFTSHHYPPRPQGSRNARAHQKIRLGYVAGEFRDHATSWLMAGLFERHDRDRFEIFAFDNGWDDASPTRGRLARAFGRITDISRLSDPAAAATIAGQEIDILVNLNGYVGLHRAGIFAAQPAPLQVNYLGSPATMGAPYMDYIIADRVLIPVEDEPFYTEKVVTLPESYQANDNARAVPGDPPSRAALSLPENGFVFGSFNSSYKLTPEVFAVWMNILKAVPDSVLWLLENNPDFARHLRRAAADADVAPQRLVFAPVLPPDRHLGRLQAAGLFLDPFPCGGHTTASDALWAGVPVLTCRGHAFGGRVAASLNAAIGMSELTVENLDDYQALALALARDPARLTALRQKLAANRLTAPLFDTARLRRHLESAFTTMWEIHRRGENPRAFAVSPMDKSP